MKVFVRNKAYVQKGDLEYFLKGSERIPTYSSILDVILAPDFKVTDENRHEFVEFSKRQDVLFFGNCDWIINYHDFDGKGEKDIDEYRRQLIEERARAAKAYDALSSEESLNKRSQTLTHLELLDYKIYSVREVMLLKNGTVKYPIPGESENAFQKVFSRLKKGQKTN